MNHDKRPLALSHFGLDYDPGKTILVHCGVRARWILICPECDALMFPDECEQRYIGSDAKVKLVTP